MYITTHIPHSFNILPRKPIIKLPITIQKKRSNSNCHATSLKTLRHAHADFHSGVGFLLHRFLCDEIVVVVAWVTPLFWRGTIIIAVKLPKFIKKNAFHSWRRKKSRSVRSFQLIKVIIQNKTHIIIVFHQSCLINININQNRQPQSAQTTTFQ